MSRKFGRAYKADQRDRKFLLETRATHRGARYWHANGWWGDQGATSQCVGYGWAHWLEDGPVTHGGPSPIVQPLKIYTEAKQVDEWPGEDYAGTSVRAGAKVLQRLGFISEYRWAFTLSAVLNCLLERGPLVVGTNWYEGMGDPEERDHGFIRATGDLLGGHCYVLNGVNTKAEKLRVKNSWSRHWGNGGHAWLSFADFKRLLSEDGEACLATELRNRDPRREAIYSA
jgi:hypothetical protein